MQGHFNSNKLVIGYIPSKSSGWILENLFHDLSDSSAATDIDYILCKNIFSLLKVIVTTRRDWKILCMHISFAKRLRKLLFPAHKVSSYYTHTRLSLNLTPEFLKSLFCIFPQNKVEAGLLINEGVFADNVITLPLGICSSMFVKKDSSTFTALKTRTTDVLFVGRYGISPYYTARKNYSMIFNVVRSLREQDINLNITFMGSGWSHCPELSKLNVNFVDVPYSEYPSIYQTSKLYVNLSAQEGGPVSWLEAMAAGCYLLSTPSGFPLELRSGDLCSWVESFTLTPREMAMRILQIVHSFVEPDAILIDKRRNFLSRYEFSTLSRIVERSLFPPS